MVKYYAYICSASVLYAIFFVIISLQLFAQTDTNLVRGNALAGRESVAFIGTLNPDSTPDTLLICQLPDFSYLPSAINWGHHDTNETFRQTILYYPKLSALSGSFALDDFNNDSITDITLFIRGITIDSSGCKNKYVRRYVLYGSNNMRSDSIVDFAVKDSVLFATLCYIRPYPITSAHQTSQIRHIGGNKIIPIGRGTFNNCKVEGNEHQQPHHNEVSGVKDQTITIGQYSLNIYPIPVLEQVNIEIYSGGIGWSAAIINEFGRECMAWRIDMFNQKFEFSVAELSSGWYCAILFDAVGNMIKCSPFIISR